MGFPFSSRIVHVSVCACMCVCVIVPEETEVAGEGFNAEGAGVDGVPPVGATDAGGMPGRVVPRT